MRDKDKPVPDSLEHWSTAIDQERRSQFQSGVRVEALKTLVGLRPMRTDGSAYTIDSLMADAETLTGFILTGDRPAAIQPEPNQETRLA